MHARPQIDPHIERTEGGVRRPRKYTVQPVPVEGREPAEEADVERERAQGGRLKRLKQGDDPRQTRAVVHRELEPEALERGTRCKRHRMWQCNGCEKGPVRTTDITDGAPGAR